MASFILGFLMGGAGCGYLGYLYAKDMLPWKVTKNPKSSNPYG